MATVQGLLFLFFGIGLLVVDWQSLEKGWLPCGPNGFKGRREFHRATEPFAYWLMFVSYGAAGFWLLGYALRVLLGLAEPLPLQ